MKKKILFILLPIVLISVILLGGTYFINNRYVNSDTIYEGVSIEEISLEGMTKEEALELVKKEKEAEIKDKSIELVFEDYTNIMNFEDIEFTYEYEKAVDEAYEIGRDGGFFSRIRDIRRLKNNPVDIKLSHKYNTDSIQDIVNTVEEELMIEPTDAIINIDNGNIEITEEVTGRKIIKEELISLIEESLESLDKIEIPLELSEAEVTKELLSQINGVIGSYSTSYSSSSAGRAHNVELSAEAINNRLVLPGEEVSFNETTGPRHSQLGYQEAPVIVNGELTPGLGGGVCQTSTTLYNALLHADVSITERSPHSIAPTYVPKGRDGAVATGYLDLKFKNDYEFPIYIKAIIVGRTLEFQIYGDTTVKDYTVKIEPELVETVQYKVQEQIDNNAAPGSRQLIQEGRTGYKVRTYKSIIKDGKVIEREEITFDYYPMRDHIYKIGPAPAAKKEAPKKESTPPPAEEKPVEEEVEDKEPSEGESEKPVENTDEETE